MTDLFRNRCQKGGLSWCVLLIALHVAVFAAAEEDAQPLIYTQVESSEVSHSLAELEALGKITVRALRAWGQLPPRFVRLALDLRGFDIDILGFDAVEIQELARQAHSSPPPLFDLAADLDALSAHMFLFIHEKDGHASVNPLPTDLTSRGQWSDHGEFKTERVLLSTRISPSKDDEVVAGDDGISVIVSSGSLNTTQELQVAAVSGGPPARLPLSADELRTIKVTIGEQRIFQEPLFIMLDYDPAAIESGLSPELAFVALYWDEMLEEWVEMPSFIDSDRHLLVIPTKHLTTIKVLRLSLHEHLYDEAGYFVLRYSPHEHAAFNSANLTHIRSLRAMRDKLSGTDEQLNARQIEWLKERERAMQDITQYPQKVFEALNTARVAYGGFRELEKIQAIDIQHVNRVWGGRTDPKKTKVKRYLFNVYIEGSGSDAKRNKVTGNIQLPYSFNGIPRFTIAHELFHAVQNRYYYALGMTELKVPATTHPSAGLLTRLWWLEASAEYAAYRLAFPDEPGAQWGMGGDFPAKRLEKPLNYSPSMLWAGSDQSAYQNAWFIEFLVKEKGIDFKDLFESVASFWSPSVYDNLVRYLKAKNLEINEVFEDYALWYFFSPHSRVHRGISSNKVPEIEFAGSFLKEPGRELRHWTFEGGAGPHRARIWEVKVPQNADTSRILLVSLLREGVPQEGRYQHLWADHPLRSLWFSVFTSAPPAILPPRQLLKDGFVEIVPLKNDDALYLVAVRNDDLGGTLGDWHPEFRVAEAELKISPAEIEDGSPNERYTFTSTLHNIPVALVSKLRFDWSINGRLSQSSMPDSGNFAEGIVTVMLENQQFKPGIHTVSVNVFDERNRMIAEAQGKVGIVGVEVPDVVGLSQPDAEQALNKVGLKPAVSTETSGTVPPGKVIRQNPAAGVGVQSGSTVNIVVSHAEASHPELKPVEGTFSVRNTVGNFTFTITYQVSGVVSSGNPRETLREGGGAQGGRSYSGFVTGNTVTLNFSTESTHGYELSAHLTAGGKKVECTPYGLRGTDPCQKQQTLSIPVESADERVGFQIRMYQRSSLGFTTTHSVAGTFQGPVPIEGTPPPGGVVSMLSLGRYWAFTVNP